MDNVSRRLPVGAEVLPKGVGFRVWAPERRNVSVVVDGKDVPFERDDAGYWSGVAEGVKAGVRYKYRLDGDATFPDPASRFQPDGPHEASEVVDPGRFQWSDGNWKGVNATGQVIYEMHVGTFTPEGTWASAESKLPYLVDTGITMIEVMPVSEFPGRFGWGYDGVHPYAPTRLYGRPDDLRSFVDRAHAVGIAVILDVVYNHLGPDGNYLTQFSKHYFTDRHKTDWGAAVNFDSADCLPVREFFTANATYWIDEFHLDGLRFDATQNIYDSSSDHILAAMSREARKAAGERPIFLVAENEPQETRIVRPPDQGGFGMDALWNDDYHHTAMVALSGHSDAYYTDYRGTPQEFISAVKYGYLFQGQWYKWQEQRRGTPAFGLPPTAFIQFTDNHDQVANSARGLRSAQLSDPGTYRAIAALTLLGPATPMIFQGQEFGARTPFFYFADHETALATMVHEGRIEFMSQFKAVNTPEMRTVLPNPADRATFERSRLDWTEVERNRESYDLHRDLLRLRKSEKVFHAQRPFGVDGAVLSERAFVLRYFSEEGDDRLLIVNLGSDTTLDPAPEPLLAPPMNKEWATLWSSEDPKYGGAGTPALDTPDNWRLPGRAAVVMSPVKVDPAKSKPSKKEKKK